MCKFFKKTKNDKKCNESSANTIVDSEEKEVLKVGKGFLRTFWGVALKNYFEYVIDDYRLSKDCHRKDDILVENYIFEYKNIKIRVEFYNNYHSEKSYVRLFLINPDDNKDELEFLKIQRYAKREFQEISFSSSWDYDCPNEHFEKFSINVMQHIMTELRDEEAKRVKYFESLIPAEDLE